MMNNIKTLLLSLVVASGIGFPLSGAAIVLPLTKLPNPSIQAPHIEVRQVDCDGNREIEVGVTINAQDAGRPGILWVGTHNDDQDDSYFLTSNGWQRWRGAMFPVHSVFRNGLHHVTFLIPSEAVRNMQPQWNLYVGYGALTIADAQTVQRMIDSIARAKERQPNKSFPTVDPDHFRLSLIQKDMTEQYKYHHVLQWRSRQFLEPVNRSRFFYCSND